MFRRWLVMHPVCSSCGLKYEREPGYFLGSIYVNYALTALTTTFVYVTLHFGVQLSNWWVVPPLVAFCILFPLAFFPFARAYWLAMDLSFDQINDEPDQPPPGFVPPHSRN